MPDGQAGSWRDGLTPKQARFVSEYMIDLNATQAAIRAGYSKATAYAIGHENLKKPEVARAIDQALADQPGITRTRIVDELSRVAFANAGDFFEWGPDGVVVKSSENLTEEQRAAVAEVSQTVTKEGGTIRLKLADKLGALEKLGKAVKLFTERHELTGANGEPLIPENHSARDIARAIFDILRTAPLADADGSEKEPTDDPSRSAPIGAVPVAGSPRHRDSPGAAPLSKKPQRKAPAKKSKTKMATARKSKPRKEK